MPKHVLGNSAGDSGACVGMKKAANSHAQPMAQSCNLKSHDASTVQHIEKHKLKGQPILYAGEHSA